MDQAVELLNDVPLPHEVPYKKTTNLSSLLRFFVVKALVTCNIRRGGWDPIPYSAFYTELSQVAGGYFACALEYYQTRSIQEDISVFNMGKTQFLVLKPETVRRVLA
jgi:hypothetical protein